MTVDLEPREDGRTHVSLGPVEKWVISLIALAIAGAGAWQVKSTQTLIVQAAVTNEQLRSINLQMSDVPSIKLELAKHAIEIKQHDDEIKELRQDRGDK
jgi:hypothetical protein